MRVFIILGFLGMSNLLWLWMLKSIRSRGLPYSPINSLLDLQSYRTLISESTLRLDRLKYSFILMAFYLFLVGVLAALVF